MIDYTRILKDIVPEQDGPGDVHRRKFTVASINVDNTVNLTDGAGTSIPSVPVLAGAQLTIGSNVQVMTERGAMLVLGKVGASVAPATTRPNAFFKFGTPSIPHATVVNLTPTSVPINDAGMWVSGTNFTIPAGQGGLYEMGLALRYAGQASPVGHRQARFNINGVNYTYVAQTANDLINTGSPGFGTAEEILVAGDVVSFSAYQTANTTLALDASSHGWLRRIR